MPRLINSYQDVARELADGLESGSVTTDTAAYGPDHWMLKFAGFIVLQLFVAGFVAWWFLPTLAFVCFTSGIALGLIQAPLFIRVRWDGSGDPAAVRSSR